MRKSRAVGEGTYSSRHNRKKSTTIDDQATSGIINKFRDLAAIPDVDGDEIDYGIADYEEYNDIGASNDEVKGKEDDDNAFDNERAQNEYGMYGEDGVDWDELSEEGDAEPPHLDDLLLKNEDNNDELQILAYSRKPRPVEFKPYTLKQYKMIKPKDYVEYSKLQPGICSFLHSIALKMSFRFELGGASSKKSEQRASERVREEPPIVQPEGD